MTIWTREALLTYRRDRGWPDLDGDICDEAVAILNEGCDALRRVRGLRDLEPAVRFMVEGTGGDDE